MTVSRSQASTENEFHYGPVPDTRAGKKPGTLRCHIWRRNGETQTWVTRPEVYRIPVKNGLRNYGDITQHDQDFHIASECPLTQGASS